MEINFGLILIPVIAKDDAGVADAAATSSEIAIDSDHTKERGGNRRFYLNLKKKGAVMKRFAVGIRAGRTASENDRRKKMSRP